MYAELFNNVYDLGNMHLASGARLVEWRGDTGTYLAVGARAVSSVVSGRNVELQIKR